MEEFIKNNTLSLGYTGVKRLSHEQPEWLPIVEICLGKAKSIAGDFAGAWVLKEFKKRGLTWKGKSWFPNLRILVSYRILQRTDVSRGGRRAYYLMSDIEGVEKALRELKDT